MSLLDRITEEWSKRGILPTIEYPTDITAPIYTAVDVIQNQQENTYQDGDDDESDR